MATPLLMPAVLATALPARLQAPVCVESLHVYNASDAAAFVQLFDAASLADVTVGTTVPKWSIGLATATSTHLIDCQVNFMLGLVVAATTTATGSSAPSAALVVNFALTP